MKQKTHPHLSRFVKQASKQLRLTRDEIVRTVCAMTKLVPSETVRMSNSVITWTFGKPSTNAAKTHVTNFPKKSC